MICVYTISIDIGLSELHKISLAQIQKYAQGIGAEYVEITDREFPDLPIACEKFQVYTLGSDNDWNIFIDADVLVKNLWDVTKKCPDDAIGHWGAYGASSWFKPHPVFDSDVETIHVSDELCSECKALKVAAHDEVIKRNVAIAGFFLVVPIACHDVWKPLIFDVIDKLTDRMEYADEAILAHNIAESGFSVYEFQSDGKVSGAQSNDDALIYLDVIRKKLSVGKDFLDKVDAYLSDETSEVNL